MKINIKLQPKMEKNNKLFCLDRNIATFGSLTWR